MRSKFLGGREKHLIPMLLWKSYQITYPEDCVLLLTSVQGIQFILRPRCFVLNFLQHTLKKCHFVYSFKRQTTWFPDWTLGGRDILHVSEEDTTEWVSEWGKWIHFNWQVEINGTDSEQEVLLIHPTFSMKRQSPLLSTLPKLCFWVLIIIYDSSSGIGTFGGKLWSILPI